MAIDQESFNKRLYDIFKTRGYKPAPKDSKNERTNPEIADVFEFQFIKDGENYGKAWATIDKTSSLNIYYDDNQAGSPPGQTKGVDYDDSWSGLLKHLKQWALSKQLNFGLHDSDRLGDDMRQRDYYKMKEKMNEGYHAVNKRTSYNDNIPNVKVVIQHDKQIGEGEQRWRNVHKIFVENTEGERFAVPTRMPGIARVYGRHVAEGGTPYDDRGKHITALVEEYTKMAGFVRATRRGEFNESVAKLIAEGVQHHKSLKETLQKMQSHRGYNHYFESWTPPLMEDEADHTSIAEMFSQELIDPRIESVLPILNKLNSNIINEIEEVNELDQWAKSITEITESEEERPYICYHTKKGKHECTASSSYGAAQKAADHWGLKSTAGIDAMLADVEHSPASLEEAKRDTHCSAKCCGADVKAADCGCPADCPHCNCNAKLDENGLKYSKEGHDEKRKQWLQKYIDSSADERREMVLPRKGRPMFSMRDYELIHQLLYPNAVPDEDGTIKYTGANIKAGREGASEEEKGKIKDKHLTKEETEMGSEDDDLRDEESGKNHDPKTGKRIKPHPFDPEDDHLKEGKHNKLVVDALEMSETEFAKKHPAVAHRYNDILAAFSDEDLKDKLNAPEQRELDLTEQEDFRTLIKKDVNELMRAASNSKQYEEEIMKRIRDRKLKIPKEADPVARKRLSSEIREYEKYKFKYDVGKAKSAANAKDASRIEANRILNKKDDPYTSPSDKVTIGTALAGLIPSLVAEAVIDEKDFSDKEIKMAYGILNDPRYKGGNQTGAIKAIEGIKAGLSEHPGVKKAIYKTQNEPDNLEEANAPTEKIKSPMTGKEIKYTILNGDVFNEYGGPLGFDDYFDIMVAHNYPAEGPTITQMYSDYKDQHGSIPTRGYNPGHSMKEEEMDEGLDANQKRAGQLGPVGGPAKVGDLVGSESKHADDEMSIHQMSDEDLADYLNVDVKDVKADRDHAEEIANDKSRDHAPDNMLEDILRLSGRTEYTGYGSTGKGAGTPYKG